MCLYSCVGAASIHKQEPSDSRVLLFKLRVCQNSELNKTESFYKLGLQSCQPDFMKSSICPRFSEGKTGSTKGPSTR